MRLQGVKNFFTALAEKRGRTLSIVNGVIGNSLEKKKIGFAIPMAFTAGGEPLSLTKAALLKARLPESGKICILAHGNCGSEEGWSFQNDRSVNYGSLLQKEFGHTPFFLRYNSGLHISTNGRKFSLLLEKLVRSYPVKISEILLIGHSMGGLVFRSACHYGEKEKRGWVRLTKKIFYLGSPHLGTHFEKLGKLTSVILHTIPNPVTKIIALLGDLRSDGIKDLRHGYVTDDDWQKRSAENLFYWHKNKTPLLRSANHYLICSTLSKVAGSKMGRLFGDGLVHPGSGFGRALFSSGNIPFLEDHCTILPGLAHHNLQRSPRVYEQIRAWC